MRCASMPFVGQQVLDQQPRARARLPVDEAQAA
jgi:hypothetical protein